MKWIKIILTSIYIFVAVPALASDYLEGVTELGTKIKISKADWPVAFRCHYYGGPKAGEFMFSIRKKKGEPAGLENAWLIFPDHMGYSGKLYRNGLDWRFDWTDRNTDSNFSVSIKRGGEGYYFDWSLADSEGRMNVKRTATCK